MRALKHLLGWQLVFVSAHWLRYHYYLVAARHMHPLHEDYMLVWRRMLESRDVIDSFVRQS